MILALLLLTLCLHAVACPQWLTSAWVVTCGGGRQRDRARWRLTGHAKCR